MAKTDIYLYKLTVDAAVTPSGIVSFTKGKDFIEQLFPPTSKPESQRSLSSQQNDGPVREEVAIEKPY